jgi:Complex I intermediate-associated protein 30 (CIA30)
VGTTVDGRRWIVSCYFCFFLADLFPASSYDVHRFERSDDIDKFQVTTDRVLGPQGHTECSFTLKPYKNFSAGLFSGAIDYRDDNPNSRGGFAAFRTRADERVRDLSSFEALELRIKSDGRPYILNLKAAHRSPDFLWQIRLVTEPNKWVTVAFPFSDMILTKRGRIELEQYPVERENIMGVSSPPEARKMYTRRLLLPTSKIIFCCISTSCSGAFYSPTERTVLLSWNCSIFAP